MHIITAKQIDAMEAQLSKWGKRLDTLAAPEGESDPEVEHNPTMEAKTKYQQQLLVLAARVQHAQARLKESIAARRTGCTCQNWRASMG